MASGAAIPDIRVYIKDYKPCIEETFLTIAHELVHVVQIQGMLGGGRIPGSWTTYYTSHFLGCAGRGSMCDNELEKEAYDFANGVANGSCGTAQAYLCHGIRGFDGPTGLGTPNATGGF